MFKWKKSSADEAVDLRAIAQKLLRYRQLRSDYIAQEAIAAGGWDLLLHLYSTADESGDVTVASAAEALGVPNGEALTAAERICHYGLAAQGDSPGNWEEIPLTLAPKGREAMARYLEKVAGWQERDAA